MPVKIKVARNRTDALEGILSLLRETKNLMGSI